MFLSNPRKSFLLALLGVTFFLACGSSQSNDNRPISLPLEPKSGFPFSTKEPKVYQGDFVLSNGYFEEKWFIARKIDKSRIDFLPGTDRWRIEIKADKVYSVWPKKRIYVEATGGDVPAGDPTAVDILSLIHI